MAQIDLIKGFDSQLTTRGDPTMQARPVLHKLLNPVCNLKHQTRRMALEETVLAALKGTRLTVTDLGRSIQSQAKQKHRIKRADRLLSNAHIHRERESLYAELTGLLVGSRTRPIIIVDWSDLDECKRHFLLRASLAVEGRSVTLYEEVHPLKSKEKPATHRTFLTILQSMLAVDCRPILVTDAGFRVPWFRLVESFGWDWIGRVRNRTSMQWAGEDGEEESAWFACKTLYEQASPTPKRLGAARLTHSNPIACQLILYKARAKGRVHKNRSGNRSKATRSRRAEAAGKEPWLLATSLPPHSHLAKRVGACYAQRMQIEEAFRDMKSPRFGLSLELHLTYQVERLQVLLLIAHLALLVAWLMGKATELTNQHWQYQANTERKRKVLSMIFIGLKVIDDRRISLTAYELDLAWQQLQESIQSHCLFNERGATRIVA